MEVLAQGRVPPARMGLAAAVAVLGWGLAGASLAGPLPEQRHQGAVTYLTGGIGRSEAEALKAASKQYPLTLTFLTNIRNKGAYTPGANVSVRSDSGESVLQARADGPMMLLDLPAGRYLVSAELNGETIEQEVEVRTGQSRQLNFEWAGGSEPQRQLYPDDMTVKLPRPPQRL